MMNKCLKLVKVQLLGQLRMKGKKGSLFLLFLLGAVLCFYSYLISYGLCQSGMAEVIPSYAIAITGLITLFFTVLKTNGVLFAYRDYDLLMALPVKTSIVITSRFITMYLMNLAVTAAVMISMGISYVLSAQPGAVFYPMWILTMFLAPLIPTTLATLIGALIIWISSRFRFANIVTVVISFALLILVLGGSMMLGNTSTNSISMEQVKNIGELVLNQIHKMYPPAALVYQAVIEAKITSFVIFAGTSVVWYGIFLALISLKYKSMNTGLMTFHSKSDYKLSGLSSSSPVKALVKKEWKRFYTCPIYILNFGMGALMAVAASAACFVVGAEKLETLVGIPGLADAFARIIPFFTPVMVGMTTTTAVSLSLEGNKLWILKSLPMDEETVYRGKVAFNLILVLPVSLLCSLLLALRVPLEPLQLVFLFLTPLVYGCFTTMVGMWINLKLPNYSWTSETTVVKQSAGSFASVMFGLANGVIPILVLIFLPEWNAALVTLAFTAVEGAGAVLLWQHIKKMKF